MEMINSRNQTSHTYNEETAQKIAKDITSFYFQEFERLQARFNLLELAEQ